MAKFNIEGSTSNSISVSVTDLDTGFAGTRVFEWYLNNNYLKDTTIPPYSGEAYFNYLELSPNTWYHLDVKIYNEDKSAMYAHFYDDAATAPAPVGPWSWTTAELNAFNNNGNFSVLTASRWNDFCDRINAICIAAGDSWLTNYTTLSGAKASGPGAPLTALMFMSVKFNIGSRGSTLPIPAIINTGDTIYGWYFITLQEKLNEWIARL